MHRFVLKNDLKAEICLHFEEVIGKRKICYARLIIFPIFEEFGFGAKRNSL